MRFGDCDCFGWFIHCCASYAYALRNIGLSIQAKPKPKVAEYLEVNVTKEEKALKATIRMRLKKAGKYPSKDQGEANVETVFKNMKEKNSERQNKSED